MNDYLISNPQKLEQLKKSFTKDGLDKIHILSDFDKTLTTAFVNGQFRSSLISILRDGGYLTLDYAKEAHALYDKYHPIEINFTMSKKDKKKYMQEWWSRHFKLLIKCGLNKKDLERTVMSEKIQFREGFNEFSEFLKINNIPLVIMSANGLGKETILMYFQKTGKLHNNLFVVSNVFIWDEQGNAVGVENPIIHSLNKDETTLQSFPDVYSQVRDRKNVILLGDSIDDIGMVEGFDFDNILKVGFLNIDIQENLDLYKNNFDVVILNDGPFSFVNDFLSAI